MLREVRLFNFRNHNHLSISLGSGINLLYGDNGSGKTSVLEGIYLALKAKSFRTNNTRDLVKEGKEKAIVAVVIHDGVTSHTLTRQISCHGSMKTKMDGKECHIAAFGNLLQTVIFTQEDIQTIKGDPSRRRDWIDRLSEEVFPEAKETIKEYGRALYQRNEILKAIRAKKERETALSPWEKIIAERGALIREMRTGILRELEKRIGRMLEEEKGVFGIRYYGTFENENDLLNKLREGRSRDILRGATNSGVHRDEMVFTLNGKNLRSKGSQGQQRKAALLITLASSSILEERKSVECLVMLDDMLSELDERSINWMLERIQDKGQVLVTSNANRIGDFKGRDIFLYQI